MGMLVVCKSQRPVQTPMHIAMDHSGASKDRQQAEVMVVTNMTMTKKLGTSLTVTRARCSTAA
jgi:hypothetical protein